MCNTPTWCTLYVSLISASPTLERVVAEVCDRYQTTDVADVDLVLIRDLVQALTEELRGAMGDLTIMLHFPEAQSSVTISNK